MAITKKAENNVPDIQHDKYRKKINVNSKDFKNSNEKIDISRENGANDVRDYISKFYGNLLEESLNDDSNRDKIRSIIEEYVEKFGLSIKGINGLNETVEVIEKTLLDFDVLTDLLKDPRIDEIRVNSWTDIRIVIKSIEYRTGFKFSSPKQAYNVAQTIARIAGESLKPDKPSLDTRLDNGVRVAIMGPPVCLTGINITVRKQREDPILSKDLLDFGTLNKDMLNFLRILLEGKACMIFYGGTGSGKTGTMGAIVRELPKDRRIISIADTDEMNLLEIDKETGEAVNSVLMWEVKEGVFNYQQAIKATLRHTPETIIPQEVRGAETVDVIDAGITDHQVIFSAHAKNIKTLGDRLLSMYKKSGSDLPSDIILKQIGNAFEIAVRMKELKDGTKKIVAISEIVGYKDGSLVTKDIFKYQVTGYETIRVYDEHLKTELERIKVHGEFKQVGYITSNLTELLIENCIPKDQVEKYMEKQGGDLL